SCNVYSVTSNPAAIYVTPSGTITEIAPGLGMGTCYSIYGTISYIYFGCGSGLWVLTVSTQTANLLLGCSATANGIAGDGNIYGGLIYVMCGNTLNTISGASTLHPISLTF